MNTANHLATENERIRALLVSGAEQRLLSLPGVLHVGVGLKEKAGKVIDRLCIRVYVTRKRVLDQLSEHERIPSLVGGIPTDVIVRLPSVATSGDSSFKATLTPGILIGNDRVGEGTLGCFARLRGQPDSVVIISNQHVLYAGGAGADARIGQPSVTCSSCSRCGVIARNIGNGGNGWGQSLGTTVIDGQTYQIGDADCGAARLITGVRPFTNQIPNIGMISGTPPPGSLGVVTNMPPTRPPNPDCIVRKFGMATGFTVGQVVQLSSADSGPIYDQDSFTGHALVRQILVMPLQGPNGPGGRIDFLDEGDSGSVVVNRHNQVIGLLRGMFSFTGDELAGMGLPRDRGKFGVVTPIQRVMDILNIEIPGNFHSTGTTSGPVIELPETSGIHVLQATPAVTRLQRELTATAGGRILAELIEKHRREIDRLLGSCRPVIVAWNRNQGPAWMAHFINSISDESCVIPETIKGITQRQALVHMGEALTAHGSEALRADLKRYGPTVLGLAGSNHIAELLRQLGTLQVAADDQFLVHSHRLRKQG